MYVGQSALRAKKKTKESKAVIVADPIKSNSNITILSNDSNSEDIINSDKLNTSVDYFTPFNYGNSKQDSNNNTNNNNHKSRNISENTVHDTNNYLSSPNSVNPKVVHRVLSTFYLLYVYFMCV